MLVETGMRAGGECLPASANGGVSRLRSSTRSYGREQRTPKYSQMLAQKRSSSVTDHSRSCSYSANVLPSRSPTQRMKPVSHARSRSPAVGSHRHTCPSSLAETGEFAPQGRVPRLRSKRGPIGETLAPPKPGDAHLWRASPFRPASPYRPAPAARLLRLRSAVDRSSCLLSLRSRSTPHRPTSTRRAPSTCPTAFPHRSDLSMDSSRFHVPIISTHGKRFG